MKTNFILSGLRGIKYLGYSENGNGIKLHITKRIRDELTDCLKIHLLRVQGMGKICLVICSKSVYPIKYFFNALQ